MTDVKETLCRLCFKNITDKSFEVINNIIGDILDVLLLKLKFDNKSNEVICNACKRRLDMALEFRSMCLSTDNTIMPYVDSEKMLQLDLREVYMRENRCELVCSQKICRLCMHPVESEFRCIRKEELEAIEKLAPEMIINIIKDPILCKPCFDSLCTHNNFLKDCLEIEEEIKGIFDSRATESQIETLPSDVFVKTEDLDNGFDINEMEMSIKAECVDIKTEDEETSDMLLQSSDNEPFEKTDCKNAEKEGYKDENGSKVKTKQKRKLDLKEVFLQEKKSELSDNSCSQKICRLCMHPVESEFRCIRKEELEAIEKLTPEIIINIIKDPIVCKPCFNSLCTHNAFLKDCLEVEEKIKGIFDSQTTESRVETTSSDVFVKIEDLDNEFDINEMEMSIKAECVHIKSEDEERSDMLLQSSNNELFEKTDCEHVEREGYKDENGSKMKTKQKHKVLYKCDKCTYKTGSESRFMSHCARHENDPALYKCESCEYETGSKKSLQRHQLIHKDYSQAKMYKCNDCDYKAKYKCLITRHQLKHKTSTQVQMYRCNNCDYETKYRTAINRHKLKHKDPSQIQMYRCNDCDYETKYKSSIIHHQRKHKDPTQIQMYKCNDCDFKTTYGSHITRHQLKHKDPSQIQMYRCNDCDFKTKYKGHIKHHQLRHKDPSQIQKYKCNNCDYESIYSSHITRHQLKHKDPSQVQMYKCNDCDFKTKHLRYIKHHQLKHKDSSQIQIYRCKDCSYETKHKTAIKHHQLKHKDPSQVQMYRCNDCDFETKYKYNIKKHQLKHKDPSQVKMHKCNHCDYETKYSSNIKYHMLKNNCTGVLC
ncbi:zinc finger protein 729-like [Anoplophora glabripennis]|uniref:zinc finger protein 729-like n=1 Tax=Anoplophora glabripennis TaxID=217634 RepID=UPI000C7670FB|nr:zinc finger protein 729-like [Anoplophora glabripennis]